MRRHEVLGRVPCWVVFFFFAGFECESLGALAFLRLTNLLVYDCMAVTFVFWFAEARGLSREGAPRLLLSCCDKENVDEGIHCTHTERREVNTAFPPGRRETPEHPAIPKEDLCRRALEPLVALQENCVEPDLLQECVPGSSLRFDEHHVQKDLCNTERLRKRRELGGARFESDELENDEGGKRCA